MHMKHNYRPILLLILIASLAIIGCSEKDNDAFVPMKDLTISQDFDWTTTHPVELELGVLTNTNEPIPGIVFEIFLTKPEPLSSPIAKGVTLADGKYMSTLTLPKGLKKIWARGFMGVHELLISGDKAELILGGAYPESQAPGEYYIPDSKSWTFLDGMTFNAHGQPNPMTNTPLEAEFLSALSATLPEGQSLANTHPQYLDPSVQTNLKLDEQAQVWLTFVTEGAGFQNALGFHTYPSNEQPQNRSEITTHTIVLPNASLDGSGGKMNSGDTVYLGMFDPGITMGFFLVADGFIKKNDVSTTAPRYYSNQHLNEESNPAKKQHSILVFDPVSQRFVIGFEDLPRSAGASDDDFEDLVFFLTVNPVTAVDQTGIQPFDNQTDTDGDGINDFYDDYPTDPELTFNNYTYGLTGLGTLAFEDLWPNVGDYDFNDMVVDYNYNQITQPGNRVKKVEMNFRLKAIGANYANGFAVETPFLSSNVYEVSSSHPSFFELEQDGPKAVMRMFSSTFDLMPAVPGSFINTRIADPYVEPVDFSVSFKLTNPVNIANPELTAPYNPFIFINRERSHEVHLPGYAPTSRMNTALFGTGEDASGSGNWYKTVDNLNWAVNIPEIWDYPIEKSQVTQGHLKFKHWAQSSGASYPDWFKNLPGYRNEAFIYRAP